MDAEDKVVSEVNNCSTEQKYKEDFNLGNGGVLSKFEYSYPDHVIDEITFSDDLKIKVDDEKDFQIDRKVNLLQKDGLVFIEHQTSSTLDLVGEQVWRGALFLSDFILHNLHIFKNANILELASGVGLTSVVAGMVAKNITITDVNKGDILDLIERNVNRNQDILRASTNIYEIDFFNKNMDEQLKPVKNDVTIILAADVVYHNQLTDAFLNTVLHLMGEKPNKVMYIALEKRFVFIIEESETFAPCYEHFKTGLEWLKKQKNDTIEWNVHEIHADFPQYFTYERTKHLVLWKIESRIK